MTKKQPVLLGPDGEPIQRRILTQELTAPEFTGIRTLWYDSVAPGMTPQRLAGILKNAEEGNHLDYLALAQDMEERELHYTSVLGTRKRAISAIEPVVEAASEDAIDVKLADAVEDLAGQTVFLEMMEHLVDAIGKGYAVSEIMWETSANQWMPYDYRARDPRFFVFDFVNRSEMRLASLSDPVHGDPMAPFKFVRHVPRLKSGIPIRGGLAKPAAWAFIFKAYSLKDWVAFAEVYGMPIRVGKYGAMSTPEDRAKLLAAVRNIGTDAAAIIPETMAIDFVEAGGGKGGGGAAVFKDLCDYLDKQVSKLVLGQTMTTDHGSSMAQAKVHENVRRDILIADARQLEATINRDLIRPFVDLNYGPQKHYPQFTLPVVEPEDLIALSDNLKKLIPLGLRISESEVRDRFGFSDPNAGEAILGRTGLDAFDRDAQDNDSDDLDSESNTAAEEATGEDEEKPARQRRSRSPAKASNSRTTKSRRKSKTSPKPKAARTRNACHCGCGTAANTPQLVVHDVLPPVVAFGLESWEEVVDPMLKPLRDAINTARDFDGFLKALPKALAKMDTERFVATLAASMAVARGLGDIGVEA